MKSREERIEELKTVVGKMPSAIIVCCVNAGYAHTGMPYNWYLSLKRLGLQDCVLAAALDEEAETVLSAQGVPVLGWKGGSEDGVTKDPVLFRREGWREIVFSKVDFVLELLKLGKDVFFSDVDVVFLKDPLHYFESQDFDLAIQSDLGADQPESFDARNSPVCSGIYFARASLKIIEMLDIAKVDISQYPGEQSFIQQRIKESQEVEVMVLPRELFPNGNYWKHRKPANPIGIHFNWQVGFQEKVKLMQSYNLWQMGDFANQSQSPINVQKNHTISMSKVFGIGLSKTGTTSLNTALNILGYRSKHFVSSIHAIFDLDAATDVCPAIFYRGLDHVFPDSKFILTVRDKDLWLKSCARHFAGEPQNDFIRGLRLAAYGCVTFDEEKFSISYDDYYRGVLDYFDGREGLLVYDVLDGWEPLCEFLGKDVPSMPFPERNITQ